MDRGEALRRAAAAIALSAGFYVLGTAVGVSVLLFPVGVYLLTDHLVLSLWWFSLPSSATTGRGTRTSVRGSTGPESRFAGPSSRWRNEVGLRTSLRLVRDPIHPAGRHLAPTGARGRPAVGDDCRPRRRRIRAAANRVPRQVLLRFPLRRHRSGGRGGLPAPTAGRIPDLSR